MSAKPPGHEKGPAPEGTDLFEHRTEHAQVADSAVMVHRPAMLRFIAPLAACLLASTAYGETVRGPAHVIDGDTLEIGSTIIRLDDIDAPELGQKCEGPRNLRSCGRLAADFLADRIEGEQIECEVASIDDYGRSIASCGHQGEDVSGWLVREGYALAYVRFSDRYAADEQAAREKGNRAYGGQP